MILKKKNNAKKNNNNNNNNKHTQPAWTNLRNKNYRNQKDVFFHGWLPSPQLSHLFVARPDCVCLSGISWPLQVSQEKTEGNRVNMVCETDHFKNRELLVDWCFIDVYLIYMIYIYNLWYSMLKIMFRCCRFSVLLWRCSLVPTTFHTRHHLDLFWLKPKVDWRWVGN